MIFQLVSRLCPKSGKKRFFRCIFSIQHDWPEHPLKKVMHPILWKAPQLSWEAKKAGLRSPTLPHKQCTGILHHCQRRVFGSPDCTGRIPAQVERSAGCIICSKLAFAPGSADCESCWLPVGHWELMACSELGAVHSFCCACSAQLQGSALSWRDARLFMLKLSWGLSLLQIFIVTNVANIMDIFV